MVIFFFFWAFSRFCDLKLKKKEGIQRVHIENVVHRFSRASYIGESLMIKW